MRLQNLRGRQSAEDTETKTKNVTLHARLRAKIAGLNKLLLSRLVCILVNNSAFPASSLHSWSGIWDGLTVGL